MAPKPRPRIMFVPARNADRRLAPISRADRAALRLLARGRKPIITHDSMFSLIKGFFGLKRLNGSKGWWSMARRKHLSAECLQANSAQKQ